MPTKFCATGDDGKEVRIEAPGPDITINVTIALQENRNIVRAELPKYFDVSRLAYGYSIGVSADYALGVGKSASGELTYVKFLNKDYGNYWYVYAGYTTTQTAGVQISLSGNLGGSIFSISGRL